MEQEQTFGMKRVKAEFNLDKNSRVDQIKNLGARMIDLATPDENADKWDVILQDMAKQCNNKYCKTMDENTATMDVTVQDIETVTMSAVKSCFTE